MSASILHPLLSWAEGRWGYVSLSLGSDGRAVIKSADGRCERWLDTGYTTDLIFQPARIRLVTYDPISLLVVREYEVTYTGTDEAADLLALDKVADQQDRDYSGLEFCPKCGSHKAFQYIGGRPMRLCSNYSVCSGRTVDNGRMYALRPLTATQQTYLLNAGRLITGKVVPPAAVGLMTTGGLVQGSRLDSSATDSVNDMTTKTPTIGLPLVDDDQLVPTASFKLLKYPFPYFNRVQSTLLANNIHRTDVNLVLGTATSSGKTVCAELCMARTLAMGGKVAYVSPLRALTQEKNDEWAEAFGDDYNIGIMTGDYQLTDARAEELNAADILCVTSEMLDSRTRKYGSERSAWIDDVRLLIVDEAHIIGTERGHAVEAGLMRFTQLNPKARILFMSATMPNVKDFAKWLTLLNGKPTEIINSPWRPTPLTWHFPRYTETGNYATNRSSKVDEALALVTDPTKANEKFLLFVHDKNTGHELLRRVKAEGIYAEFHNADAPRDVRQRLEHDFKDPLGKLRVLVATSTLAWGVNVPAKNAVIVGTTRGIQPVEMADILQMAGRAGRALPPAYFIAAPDSATSHQTSFDRLTLRLVPAGTMPDRRSKGEVVDLPGAKLPGDDDGGAAPTPSRGSRSGSARRRLDEVGRIGEESPVTEAAPAPVRHLRRTRRFA